MANNLVDATFPAEDQDWVLQTLKAVNERLPFLIGLTPEQRQCLAKMGDKTVAFVEKALRAADLNPTLIPASVDVAGLRKDVELVRGLMPVLDVLTQLRERVDDTVTESGSEAFAVALEVYQHLKASGKNTGLDESLKDMGQRFARRPRTPKPTEPTPTE